MIKLTPPKTFTGKLLLFIPLLLWFKFEELFWWVIPYFSVLWKLISDKKYREEVLEAWWDDDIYGRSCFKRITRLECFIVTKFALLGGLVALIILMIYLRYIGLVFGYNVFPISAVQYWAETPMCMFVGFFIFLVKLWFACNVIRVTRFMGWTKKPKKKQDDWDDD